MPLESNLRLGWDESPPPDRAYGYANGIHSDDEMTHFNHRRNGANGKRDVGLAERVWFALAELRDCTEFNPDKLSGVPVLRGTRFTLAQLLAELSEGRTISDISESFGIEIHLVEQFLSGLSAYLNRPAL